MKAVSLWQPWATGMALGVKVNETRGFVTKHRGALAIHAALRWSDEQRKFTIERRSAGDLPWRNLDFGAIVAVVNVDDVVRVEMLPDLSELERVWGDYSPGRYAWRTSGLLALTKPVQCRGMQGIWNLSDEVAEAVSAQLPK